MEFFLWLVKIIKSNKCILQINIIMVIDFWQNHRTNFDPPKKKLPNRTNSITMQ